MYPMILSDVVLPETSLSDRMLPMTVILIGCYRWFFLIECYTAMMILGGKYDACSHRLCMTFVTNFFLGGLGLAGATPISQHGRDLDQGRRPPPPPVDGGIVPGFLQWQQRDGTGCARNQGRHPDVRQPPKGHREDQHLQRPPAGFHHRSGVHGHHC